MANPIAAILYLLEVIVSRENGLQLQTPYYGEGRSPPTECQKRRARMAACWTLSGNGPHHQVNGEPHDRKLLKAATEIIVTITRKNVP
jgi:hypothetical protein